MLGVFLDITKAFDSVNHDILIHKLEHYGFRGHAFGFLGSYLNDRKQYTSIQDTPSETLCISYGVPQGSILCPLLFLLYINDLQNCITNSDIRLFADDTAMFLRGDGPETITTDANNEMKNIVQWYNANKSKLSLNKSNLFLFHGIRKKNKKYICEIKIGKDSIPRTEYSKYIGLTIGETLTWEYQVNAICNSLLKYFGIFYHIRNTIFPSLARILYFACIHSWVKYAIEVYGTASQSRINKLQILQNKLMKLLTRKCRMYSTNALHTDLNILKVKDIHETVVPEFVYSCMKDTLIDPFVEYFKLRGDEHNDDSRNNDNITTRTIHINMGKGTTLYTGATLWNKLPNEIIKIDQADIFKKEHFLHFAKANIFHWFLIQIKITFEGVLL